MKRVQVTATDGSLKIAEVIKERVIGKIKEYYVHYENSDKRLDEWILAKCTTPFSNEKAEVANIIGSASAASSAAIASQSTGIVTRTRKRRLESVQPLASLDPNDPQVAQIMQLEHEHQEATKLKNISSITFGKYNINAWYFSPFPDEYANADRLYICEFCLKYMKNTSTYSSHLQQCNHRAPVGAKVYSKDGLSLYQMDGETHKLYCQNLCLLAKLFMDHKTLYYDIASFMFYVLTEDDSRESHLVGYFSKEKDTASTDYNLACIMILPPHQRKGYGHVLIQFSYEFSKHEKILGTPERPLSDLGLRTYHKFWLTELVKLLKKYPSTSLAELSQMTGFKTEDIISCLTSVKLLRYWKSEYILSFTTKQLDDITKNYPPRSLSVDPSKIKWSLIPAK